MESRSIRVFISSTFLDMQADREELVKHVFPQLRELCERRGVSWGEVDLRWGITDEQRAKGEVLEVCLAEVEECQPYFVGLLGERYGIPPQAIESSLVDRQPWLVDRSDRSVTELEIACGVLQNPDTAAHAFFYLRDPEYAQRDARFQERPSEQELWRLGGAMAEDGARRRRDRLAALKDEIRASGLPVREGYRDPAELGRLVLADLTNVIDTEFPEGSEPTPFERERAFHEEFARARSPVYIGRDRDLERLDRHATDTGGPLVVIGESGVGKSSLLANWARRWRTSTNTSAYRQPEAVVMHFAAASPDSGDWTAIVRRIVLELSLHFELRIEPADDTDALAGVLAATLEAAAEKGRFVLLIDALDQLEDRDGAPDLVWLPATLPANARLLLSALPGRALSEARRRGWETYEVKPLARREREELIVQYLGQYKKRLPEAAVRRIASDRSAGNPLFLRSLLEELRVHGEHVTLSRRIDELLSAGERRGRADHAIPRLYELIFTRWENDYDRGRPGLVDDALSLLYCARRGLAETELLALLGDADGPLPHAFWSPLRLAAKQALVEHGGLLTFAHDYVRQAVASRYLPEERHVRATRRDLADYFAKRARTALRTLEEQPWQLREAGAWRELYAFLTEPNVGEALGQANEHELTGYWLELERHARASGTGRTQPGIVEAYADVLRDPESHDTTAVTRVAKLLRETGNEDQSLALCSHLARRHRGTVQLHDLGTALGWGADILRERGELDAAFDVYRANELVCDEIGDRRGVQAAMGGRARVLMARRDLDAAMHLLADREDLCFELGDSEGLAESHGDQATILRARGDLGPALDRYMQEERLGRRAGSPRLIAAGLAGQSGLLVTRGRLRRADPLLAAWRQTWWDFANDADRRRWSLGIALTTANRRVLLYFKLLAVLLAGSVPVGIAAYQLGTLAEAVGPTAKAMAYVLLAAAAALLWTLGMLVAWRRRLVVGRRYYRTVEAAGVVGAGPPTPELPLALRDVNGSSPLVSVEATLRRILGERAVVVSSFMLVTGTAMTAIALRHLLASTLPCGDLTFRSDCYSILGWDFAMLAVGLALAVLAAIVLEAHVVLPVYVGTIGIVTFIVGLESPLIGLKKWSLVGFGAGSLIVGFGLGAVFWITGRR